MSNTFDENEEIDFLIYSSKVGVILRQEKGRFLVDKTYRYDVADDVLKISRGNNATADELSASAWADWNREQNRCWMSRRRAVVSYTADVMLVSNESGQTSSPRPATARAPAGLAVDREALRLSDFSAVCYIPDEIPLASASIVSNVAHSKAPALTPFDGTRKAFAETIPFADAAKKSLIEVIEHRKRLTNANLTLCPATTDSATKQPSVPLSRCRSDLQRTPDSCSEGHLVTIKVLYELDNQTGFNTKQTARLEVSTHVKDAPLNCVIVRDLMIKKLIGDSTLPNESLDSLVLFFDAEMGEYVLLEDDSWVDFMDQTKKMLRASIVPIVKKVDHPTICRSSPPSIDLVELVESDDAACPDEISRNETDLQLNSLHREDKNDYMTSLQASGWISMIGHEPKNNSELISINGIRINGLNWQAVCSLMLQRSRPMLLHFKANTISVGISDMVTSSPAPKGDVRNFTAESTFQIGSFAYESQISNEILARRADNKKKENLFKYETFESKYNHPLAIKLRKQVDKICSNFVECDWMQAIRTGSGTPQGTVHSLYRYIESEMSQLGLLNNQLPQGGGVPMMDEIQIDLLRGHIESFVMSRLGEHTLRIGPFGDGYETYINMSQRNCCSDASQFHFDTLKERLSFLSFLSPTDLGFVIADSSGSKKGLDYISSLLQTCPAMGSGRPSTGRLADEWYVAIREITRACMGTTFAPSEIVHRFHSAIQLATLAAERYHIAGTHTRLQIFDAPALSAVASKAHEPSYPNEHKKLFTQNLCRTAAASQEFQNRPPPILGADDILPIVTWLLIQSNPTNVETIIWYCSEFRHPALAFGHANYSLAQISSALEFVKTAGPAELSSYPTLPDQIRSLSNYLQRHQNTQQLIENCKLGSNEDCLQQLISNGGADLDGYSLDKCDTPLSGAVRFRQHKVVSFLLNLALKDSNDCISTSGGFKFIDIDKPLNPAYAGEPPFCYTALHLAVRVGDINTVILLLNAGANRYSCDSEGNSPLLLAIKYNHSEIQKILVSDPLLCSLVPEIFRGSVATVYGLIKQKQFSCTSNAMQECSPIAASVLSLNECILSILIGQVYDDNNNKAFDINAVNGNGETALMLCGSRKKEGLLVNLTDKGSCKEHSNGIIQYYDEIISNASLEYESEDYRRMKLAVRLIQAGAVAGVVDSRGLIAFVHCLLNGFVDIDSGFSCTTLDENCEVTDETAEEGASILSIPKSTATETASSLILSSRNILQNKCDIDKISLTCAALVKRIDSAQENCKAEQANTWCRYPRLTAVMLYSPRTHKIYQCARDKCYHAVRALLDHGEDPNLRCPVEDYTALLASVQNSSIMIFNALLADARTDLNFPRVLSNNMTALHFAASTGNTNMVGCLLWAGANRLAVTLDNKRAIDYAIEAGHKESADVLNFDPDKVSISLAAKHGDIRVTKALLAQGVSINTMRRHFVDKLIKHHLFTPLLAATAYGQIEYINFLLAYSEANGVYMQMQSLENSLLKSELLEINAANLEAHTALMVAAMVGHEEILLLLLNRGKANRYLVDMNGATAADWAKLRGFDSIFDILRYDPSRCSIHAFVSNGNLGACVALFKQRVDPNEPYISGSQNKIDQSAAAVSMAGVIEGETPLAIAARKNHLPIMRLLLQAPGILTDSRDTDGVTPLGRASEAGNEAAVLLLLKHGCSRSHSDFRGRRPVDLALSKGHIEIAALLEVDPLHANCYNLCAEGRIALVEALLKQGVSPNLVDLRPGKKMEPILVLAARSRKIKVVELLLASRDIDVNAADADGATALMRAAGVGDLKITEVLLKHRDIDSNKVDLKGKSASDYAANYSFLAYARYIVQDF